jgi:hypothetical protein
MITLIAFDGNAKYTTNFTTLEEALSGAKHAFDLNHELHAIEKDGAILLLHCEIYKKIGRTVY